MSHRYLDIVLKRIGFSIQKGLAASCTTATSQPRREVSWRPEMVEGCLGEKKKTKAGENEQLNRFMRIDAIRRGTCVSF
jgi:hypothetical protein